jgi:hypothetical protein
MTPAQCRAARALIGMSQSQLGFASVVPLGAIIDFEAETATPKDVARAKQALESQH